MDLTYTGEKTVHRDGRDDFAEVEVRFLWSRWASGVGFSSEAQRYLNATFCADFAARSDDIWHSVKKAMEAGERRLARRPGGLGCRFGAQVVRIRTSEGASAEDLAYLLAEASREATGRYFEALNEGRIQLDASDLDRPFEYRPSTGFDEQSIARRRCFLEYVAEKRPGFLFGCAVSLTRSIDEDREQGVLTPAGVSDFGLAVNGYMCGCRPEADALVARAHDMITLADETGEKAAGDFAGAWGLGRRYTALAYLHWLRTGERHEVAIAKANRHLLTFFTRMKPFDRTSANLAAPELLFLEADAVVVAMAKRLAANPGRGSATPGGLFGDALKIATVADSAERGRLKAKLRKRMPLHLFRWMHRGHYANVAFILHALFPRPEGPPSRLIEHAWDFMPELERRPAANFGWDIARKSM